MLGTIIDLFTTGGATGIFGVISGLAGGITTAITNFKMAKLKMLDAKEKRAHARLMVDAETKAMVAEVQAGIEKVVEEGKSKESLAEAEAYIESQKRSATPLFQKEYMTALQAFSKHKYFGWLSSVAIFGITTGFAFVDIIKSLMRPTMTLYMMGLATWITILAWKILAMAGVAPLNSEQAYQIFSLAIQTIWYLTVTSYTWWFCDRRTAKFMNEKLSGFKL